ncbi:RagB/SusD family nutrient uptake outer membrane protein [Dysgonomonas sp. ZJ709]|uniref:RagB/SusD family nutrient uptake outer membrane protein n=1 Tax=Dysgonomonas sp. ZJ709 TaxID=2709797 RepID=UPI0013ED839E|nr:RagB/SusD family nutrient uptake outer membrane protein [Dysgonomonas sp. ZJ709]
MKKYIFAIAIVICAYSCDDFIDVSPTAVVDQDYAYSQPEAMVTSAYAVLGDDWYTYPFNLWPYGDVASDDAYKGGGSTGDTNYHPIDIFSALSASNPDHMDELWYRLYVAVSRCNRAIISLNEYGEAVLGSEKSKKRMAEVRFLRGHFYFKLISLYRQVPWIDENVVINNSHESTRNDEYSYEELIGKIMEDFDSAYKTLDTYPEAASRVSKTAAACYLAKCHLILAYPQGSEYQVTNVDAAQMKKVIDYTDFVMTTATNYGYASDFGEIFMPDQRNGRESIFAVQHSLDDNTVYGRANWSNTLNATWGLFTCGWDFHKPSQNLVNAFKTENGLPMFDTFNNTTWYPEAAKTSGQKCDPRLFHTVAIPGFPYKYDMNTIFTYENTRTPNTYGYYSSLKENVPVNSTYVTYNGSWQAVNQNDYVFRYTDVMLMRAEALVELGELAGALTIINDIRTRAANSVEKYIPYAKDYCEIKAYPNFANKDYARKALQWERRLEMAMESSRFFDLRRWGIAGETLNKFYDKEKNVSFTYTDLGNNTVTQSYAAYYKDARFTAGKNEFFPIPYNQLNYIPGLYKQNKGY